MLDNELTMWIGADGGRTYPAGASFVEPFRVVAEGANLSPRPASLLVTYLIPVGSAVTTLEGASALPAGQPGAPQESRLLTVVSGEVTVLTGATQQTYTAGQHWIEKAGQAWLSGNTGDGPAVVAVSTTLPLN
jgi:hypothetical protein